MQTVSTLTLDDLRLNVHLGVTAGERENQQGVSLSFRFDFDTPPGACATDKLDHTLCYGTVAETAAKLVQGREFNTIEYLGAEIYRAVEPLVVDKASALTVTVHKLSPPVPDLHGGATFTCGGQIGA